MACQFNLSSKLSTLMTPSFNYGKGDIFTNEGRSKIASETLSNESSPLLKGLQSDKENLKNYARSFETLIKRELNISDADTIRTLYKNANTYISKLISSKVYSDEVNDFISDYPLYAAFVHPTLNPSLYSKLRLDRILSKSTVEDQFYLDKLRGFNVNTDNNSQSEVAKRYNEIIAGIAKSDDIDSETKLNSIVTKFNLLKSNNRSGDPSRLNLKILHSLLSKALIRLNSSDNFEDFNKPENSLFLSLISNSAYNNYESTYDYLKDQTGNNQAKDIITKLGGAVKLIKTPTTGGSYTFKINPSVRKELSKMYTDDSINYLYSLVQIYLQQNVQNLLVGGIVKTIPEAIYYVKTSLLANISNDDVQQFKPIDIYNNSTVDRGISTLLLIKVGGSLMFDKIASDLYPLEKSINKEGLISKDSNEVAITNNLTKISKNIIGSIVMDKNSKELYNVPNFTFRDAYIAKTNEQLYTPNPKRLSNLIVEFSQGTNNVTELINNVRTKSDSLVKSEFDKLNERDKSIVALRTYIVKMGNYLVSSNENLRNYAQTQLYNLYSSFASNIKAEGSVITVKNNNGRLTVFSNVGNSLNLINSITNNLVNNLKILLFNPKDIRTSIPVTSEDIQGDLLSNLGRVFIGISPAIVDKMLVNDKGVIENVSKSLAATSLLSTIFNELKDSGVVNIDSPGYNKILSKYNEAFKSMKVSDIPLSDYVGINFFNKFGEKNLSLKSASENIFNGSVIYGYIKDFVQVYSEYSENVVSSNVQKNSEGNNIQTVFRVGSGIRKLNNFLSKPNNDYFLGELVTKDSELGVDAGLRVTLNTGDDRKSLSDRDVIFMRFIEYYVSRVNRKIPRKPLYFLPTNSDKATNYTISNIRDLGLSEKESADKLNKVLNDKEDFVKLFKSKSLGNMFRKIISKELNEIKYANEVFSNNKNTKLAYYKNRNKLFVGQKDGKYIELTTEDVSKLGSNFNEVLDKYLNIVLGNEFDTFNTEFEYMDNQFIKNPKAIFEIYQKYQNLNPTIDDLQDAYYEAMSGEISDESAYKIPLDVSKIDFFNYFFTQSFVLYGVNDFTFENIRWLKNPTADAFKRWGSYTSQGTVPNAVNEKTINIGVLKDYPYSSDKMGYEDIIGDVKASNEIADGIVFCTKAGLDKYRKLLGDVTGERISSQFKPIIATTTTVNINGKPVKIPVVIKNSVQLLDDEMQEISEFNKQVAKYANDNGYDFVAMTSAIKFELPEEYIYTPYTDFNKESPTEFVFTGASLALQVGIEDTLLSSDYGKDIEDALQVMGSQATTALELGTGSADTLHLSDNINKTYKNLLNGKLEAVKDFLNVGVSDKKALSQVLDILKEKGGNADVITDVESNIDNPAYLIHPANYKSLRNEIISYIESETIRQKFLGGGLLKTVPLGINIYTVSRVDNGKTYIIRGTRNKFTTLELETNQVGSLRYIEPVYTNKLITGIVAAEGIIPCRQPKQLLNFINNPVNYSFKNNDAPIVESVDIRNLSWGQFDGVYGIYNKDIFIGELSKEASKVFDKHITVFSTRIPNVGLNSMSVTKAIGFLYNSNADEYTTPKIIMSPKQTLIYGDDFDADKLYTFYYSLDSNGNADNSDWNRFVDAVVTRMLMNDRQYSDADYRKTLKALLTPLSTDKLEAYIENANSSEYGYLKTPHVKDTRIGYSFTNPFDQIRLLVLNKGGKQNVGIGANSEKALAVLYNLDVQIIQKDGDAIKLLNRTLSPYVGSKYSSMDGLNNDGEPLLNVFGNVITNSTDFAKKQIPKLMGITNTNSGIPNGLMLMGATEQEVTNIMNHPVASLLTKILDIQSDTLPQYTFNNNVEPFTRLKNMLDDFFGERIVVDGVLGKDSLEQINQGYSINGFKLKLELKSFVEDDIRRESIAISIVNKPEDVLVNYSDLIERAKMISITGSFINLLKLAHNYNQLFSRNNKTLSANQGIPVDEVEFQKVLSGIRYLNPGSQIAGDANAKSDVVGGLRIKFPANIGDKLNNSYFNEIFNIFRTTEDVVNDMGFISYSPQLRNANTKLNSVVPFGQLTFDNFYASVYTSIMKFVLVSSNRNEMFVPQGLGIPSNSYNLSEVSGVKSFMNDFQIFLSNIIDKYPYENLYLNNIYLNPDTGYYSERNIVDFDENTKVRIKKDFDTFITLAYPSNTDEFAFNFYVYDMFANGFNFSAGSLTKNLNMYSYDNFKSIADKGYKTLVKYYGNKSDKDPNYICDVNGVQIAQILNATAGKLGQMPRESESRYDNDVENLVEVANSIDKFIPVTKYSIEAGNRYIAVTNIKYMIGDKNVVNYIATKKSFTESEYLDFITPNSLTRSFKFNDGFNYSDKPYEYKSEIENKPKKLIESFSGIKSLKQRIAMVFHVKLLQNFVPNVRFEYLTNSDFESKYGNGIGATVYDRQTGHKIVINKSKMTSDVFLHEVAHIVLPILKMQNLEQWNTFVAIAKEHPYWQSKSKLYGDIGEEALAEEVMAHIIGEAATHRLSDSSWFDVGNLILQWFSRQLNKFVKFLTLNSFSVFEEPDSFDEFVNSQNYTIGEFAENLIDYINAGGVINGIENIEVYPDTIKFSLAPKTIIDGLKKYFTFDFSRNNAIEIQKALLSKYVDDLVQQYKDSDPGALVIKLSNGMDVDLATEQGKSEYVNYYAKQPDVIKQAVYQESFNALKEYLKLPTETLTKDSIKNRFYSATYQPLIRLLFDTNPEFKERINSLIFRSLINVHNVVNFEISSFDDSSIDGFWFKLIHGDGNVSVLRFDFNDFVETTYNKNSGRRSIFSNNSSLSVAKELVSRYVPMFTTAGSKVYDVIDDMKGLTKLETGVMAAKELSELLVSNPNGKVANVIIVNPLKQEYEYINMYDMANTLHALYISDKDVFASHFPFLSTNTVDVLLGKDANTKMVISRVFDPKNYYITNEQALSVVGNLFSDNFDQVLQNSESPEGREVLVRYIGDLYNKVVNELTFELNSIAGETTLEKLAILVEEFSTGKLNVEGSKANLLKSWIAISGIVPWYMGMDATQNAYRDTAIEGGFTNMFEKYWRSRTSVSQPILAWLANLSEGVSKQYKRALKLFQTEKVTLENNLFEEYQKVNGLVNKSITLDNPDYNKVFYNLYDQETWSFKSIHDDYFKDIEGNALKTAEYNLLEFYLKTIDSFIGDTKRSKNGSFTDLDYQLAKQYVPLQRRADREGIIEGIGRKDIKMIGRNIIPPLKPFFNSYREEQQPIKDLSGVGVNVTESKYLEQYLRKGLHAKLVDSINVELNQNIPAVMTDMFSDLTRKKLYDALIVPMTMAASLAKSRRLNNTYDVIMKYYQRDIQSRMDKVMIGNFNMGKLLTEMRLSATGIAMTVTPAAAISTMVRNTAMLASSVVVGHKFYSGSRGQKPFELGFATMTRSAKELITNNDKVVLFMDMIQTYGGTIDIQSNIDVNSPQYNWIKNSGDWQIIHEKYGDKWMNSVFWVAISMSDGSWDTLEVVIDSDNNKSLKYNIQKDNISEDNKKLIANNNAKIGITEPMPYDNETLMSYEGSLDDIIGQWEKHKSATFVDDPRWMMVMSLRRYVAMAATRVFEKESVRPNQYVITFDQNGNPVKEQYISRGALQTVSKILKLCTSYSEFIRQDENFGKLKYLDERDLVNIRSMATAGLLFLVAVINRYRDDDKEEKDKMIGIWSQKALKRRLLSAMLDITEQYNIKTYGDLVTNISVIMNIYVQMYTLVMSTIGLITEPDTTTKDVLEKGNKFVPRPLREYSDHLIDEAYE